jgi:hypothetical protein
MLSTAETCSCYWIGYNETCVSSDCVIFACKIRNLLNCHSSPDSKAEIKYRRVRWMVYVVSMRRRMYVPNTVGKRLLGILDIEGE